MLNSDLFTPVRFCRSKYMSVAVSRMSAVTAMVDPVDTSH